MPDSDLTPKCRAMVLPSLSLETQRRIGLARAINKSGFASRSQAEKLVASGVVKLNGRIVRDPESPTLPSDRIEIDGKPLVAQSKVYLMLNKPRGLVTTASDEKNRRTVFDCLSGLNLPHVGPVGRLDMASEGLLLFTNDTAWADALLDPARGIPKTYHVQANRLVTAQELETLQTGIVDGGEALRASAARILRTGEKTCWLEIVLCEGKNREIRRMLEVLGIEVDRLVRVSLASLTLGDLAKGAVRALTSAELRELDRFDKR